MSVTMPLKPRMSEKAYALSKALNTYVFEVPMTANTTTVAAAVAEQFEVTVEDVRVMIVKGKVKRSYRKGGRPITGTRSDMKKALVRIKAGDKIAIFEALEAEDAKTEDKAKKAPVKADKPVATAPKKGLRAALGRSTQRQTQSRGGDK